MHPSARILLFVVLLAPLPAARGDVLLTALDRAEPIRGISLEADARTVTVQSAQGPVVKLPSEQIVEIISVPAPPAPPPKARPFEVELVDGTRVRGLLAAGRSGDSLRLRSPVLRQGAAEIFVDLESVYAIRRVDDTPGLASSRLVRIPGKDAAYRLSTARVEGFVAGFHAAEVEIDRDALGATRIPYRDLAALFIENEPLPAPPGLHVVARLADGGQVILATDFRIEAGLLKGKTPSKLELRIPTAHIAALGFKGGRFEHVSDLEPVDIRRTPFFPLPEGPAAAAILDFVCPVRFDRSPDGRGIRLKKRRYFKGIGVRPTTEITFALDGTYRVFESLAGIDDEVLEAGYGHGAGTGSVVFAVRVDGKEVFESGPVEGGGTPALVRVELPSGAKTLTLVVRLVPAAKMPTGATDSPELDNAVWARPLLIR